MKKVDTLLKEYVGRQSDENLKFLDSRFSQRLSGDLAEAVTFMSQVTDMDRWLATAKGATEFYDMLDLVARQVEREMKRRGYYEDYR